ncbi:MAG: aminomethyl-transferring glycine dehydrogenase [Rhodospirillales bacterium]|jgi:glycine dehydrogenase|nr:aminomethyl-transferring glycine dehydrogenase [Rhodospirillales bacterium]
MTAARRRSLAELENASDFVRRHIGPGDADIAAMLDVLGIDSLATLIERTVPAAIRSPQPQLPVGVSEPEALARLEDFASRNRILKSVIGMGYHDCHTPAVILRNVIENPSWYTAYTPYQPEISQGRLEALLNFQQMVIDLTGMELANASLLDEATAAAEAMTLMKRVSTNGRNSVFVSADCHPQTIAVLETRARPMGIEVTVGEVERDLDPGRVFGVLMQYPATNGEVRDNREVVERAHEGGALVTVAADLLSLAILAPPGEWGADVVVGSAQRFGVPLGFGGPHAAFMATRDAFTRSVPGRIVGVSVDDRGRTAYRLALQTREQHIRREKATSNICTAQVLLAVVAAFYAIYHGPDGIRTIAERVHRLTRILAEGLKRGGVEVETGAFFDTITAAAGEDASAIVARARAAGFNLRAVAHGRLGIALDETTTSGDVEALWRTFAGEDAAAASVDAIDAEIVAGASEVIPEPLRRTSAFLTHPVFERYRSETGMLRYLRRLEEKDIALNRSMIPLGSCTMKLNAAAEMTPITWPGFARIHPFVPLDQAEGYLAMIAELEGMLTELTGFAAVSVQPNAGSQGEYAGLLVIRKFHESRGQGHRDICLIPASAHGTNPASAMMAHFRVVVVACDGDGNIDLDDLRAKARENTDRLAVLMVTYPSTHGVFEEGIVEVCRVVHENGAQVYLDGANLNALLGVSKPGAFGPDVAHMNLHKTFCIPHGGGGPGVGPIGVASHLAPFLPNHPLVAEAGPATGIGPVTAAPWGSAGVLPISWAYIALMGTDGLTKATQVAILNANYVAKRLAPRFPVLFTGRDGLVAHECIIDVRGAKEATGVTVEDIAKRLMDYGFHAPTMSWPVAGTLMVEPTESESKDELDRFCDAMIAIADEIGRIESGEWSPEDNPLRYAPHTFDVVAAADWTRAYSRERAAFPVERLRDEKYWPPVGRIDNVYGDRNLVCTCPPIDAYREAAE